MLAIFSLIVVLVPLSAREFLKKPVSYLGVEASDNYTCKFYPMTLFVEGNNIGIVHSPRMSDSQLKAFETIFDDYEIEYIIKDRYVFIPCEYYSDINYLMNISKKAFSE